MATIEFRFGMGEEVTINANGMKGKVTVLLQSKTSQQFCVMYVDHTGMVHETYFIDDELSKA